MAGVNATRSRGQVTLEYFLIFSAVSAVTFLVLTTFDEQVRNNLASFYTDAANQLAKP